MPLSRIYPDSEDSPFRVDVVAVHGLNPRGKEAEHHALGTWTAPDGHLWLRDDLPKILPEARIFIYQYDAAVVYGSDRTTFLDKANDLLEQIRCERNKATERLPIIFVGHSMGGLLIKQALINAQQNQKYTSIKEATTGLAFFATPHFGGKAMLVSTGKAAADIAHGLGFRKGDRILEILDEGSTCSDIMREGFRHQQDEYQIVSFWGSRDSVVQRDSSRLGLPGHWENIVSLDADHTQVCKFGQSQSERNKFKVVRRNMEDLYDFAIKKCELLHQLSRPDLEAVRLGDENLAQRMASLQRGV
ncbi:uncharacterized protein B0I36DRAFT_332472 [Microdochium trichocladiopsis]|uniref:DUF676 domain-containing protein n=1 Tax=Microdochium trichocladiopsis TaxID=1682393 RepID=A0A9P8XYF2_9PEZI|nr:uncharacterized protein B0I36DRAFT_332472 [Microdochium trichocladiopsis]KAH7025067.1 hypothetical protein B0I36DRAFT_332472 [Microdochium trichocladiopsis]